MDDLRLVYRGNKILGDIFSKSTHCIRQICKSESEAKGFYRFLKNERVSEDDIVSNLSANCKAASAGKYVVCIQDTTEINLSSHRNRIKNNDAIGSTNAKAEEGLGFFIHPSLVLDATTGLPYGYADVKVFNRPQAFKSKFERKYNQLPIEEKESYKWIETSKRTKEVLSESVKGMVIVEDREGDIYEQFASMPDEQTDLLIRARTNRTLLDKTKLFSCLEQQDSKGGYQVVVEGCVKKKRKKRTAALEVRFKEVEILKTDATSKGVAATKKLWLIEVKEVGYQGADKICWRLLTTISIANIETGRMCIEWYSWRWMIEEVFKILKEEGYNIEASELQDGYSIRKLCLMIMEVIIKLLLMRWAYTEAETRIEADSCFSRQEQECMDHQIKELEGKTQKQKNPYITNDLKRYVWVIARLGGWKGYESKRIPGITTLWIGIKQFKATMDGWQLHRFVSTR